MLRLQLLPGLPSLRYPHCTSKRANRLTIKTWVNFTNKQPYKSTNMDGSSHESSIDDLKCRMQTLAADCPGFAGTTHLACLQQHETNVQLVPRNTILNSRIKDIVEQALRVVDQYDLEVCEIIDLAMTTLHDSEPVAGTRIARLVRVAVGEAAARRLVESATAMARSREEKRQLAVQAAEGAARGKALEERWHG